MFCTQSPNVKTDIRYDLIFSYALECFRCFISGVRIYKHIVK